MKFINYMPYALLTDPNAAGSVYARLANGELWYSGDEGEEWEKLDVDLGGLCNLILL